MSTFFSWCWNNYFIIAAVWGVISGLREMVRRAGHGQRLDVPLILGCMFGGLVFGLLWPIFLPLQILGSALLLLAAALGQADGARRS